MEFVDVLLIHPPYHRRAGSGIIPPIGLAYIASSLEIKGFSVAIIDCALDCGSQTPAGLHKFQQYLKEKLDTITPLKCIGVGPTTTPALKSIYVLAKTLKKQFPKTPIVYGGPFASMPSQTPIFFDLLEATALIRGEGEEVFSLLVEALHQGNIGEPIPGVSWHKDDMASVALVKDVNTIPFPARHLLDIHRYRPSLRRNVFDGPITPIYWSRGCPYHCNFCVSPMLRGNRITRRTQANLFAEMRECVQDFGITGFIFYDDCLFIKSINLNQKVQQFCLALREEVGLVKWEMEMRCDAVAALTAETLYVLSDSGCHQINMGIEKASNQHLKLLNKHLTIEEIVAACQKVRSTVPDIRLAGSFILGGPDETESDIEATIAFAKNLSLDFAHFYPLEIYPGTPFFAQVVNSSQQPTTWAYHMLEDEENYWGEILYETEELPGWRLLELTHRAYDEFYNRAEWLERFAATTSGEVYSTGKTVVERWCKDRFHLSFDEAESQLIV
ncbi:MAG: B12-binding domain-containing radical SAM protein [Symploca sp. SIO1C2]|nr:B12-binding domain-containing radical SAM protein [Symploca sp. SIO1C2]